MKQLIDLFNKKYGKQYGVIDDSFSNEDTYKIYKIIKTLCSDDKEIMTVLEKVKLPEPKTAKESIEKININVEGGGGNDNVPHYNETLIYEIHGEDFNNLMNNTYFNINALDLDETKLYAGKIKDDIDDTEESSFKFVYDKENDMLVDEDNEVYISNHKSYDGANFIENENSAVISFFITTMGIVFEGNGYLKLYEVDKVELDNNCLSDDVKIKNSLTVGSRIGDIGKYSVAEGVGTVASGYGSHTEGNGTRASGIYSHAEGNYTTASGYYSHTEGNNTKASGQYSHAEGVTTTASGHYSHAEGYYTTASGEDSHVEGKSSNLVTSVIQDLSSSTTNDDILTAWKTSQFSLAKGEASHVEGKNCLALGDNSHAEGYYNTATGNTSHAEGYCTTATGNTSHVEGLNTTASGTSSHAEGSDTTASGDASHAEGVGTTASAPASHAEGMGATATGVGSHAEGDNTTASGQGSHAEGDRTIASSDHQHVQGKFNIEDTANTYAHIVGNGRADTARSNAHTLDWNGNGWYAGKLSQDGTPTEDKDLVTKKYVDEKTASIDTTINNTLPSNGLLTLTTDKIQTTTLAVPTDITLPTVTGYTEIHLFFEGSEGVTITTGTTTVRWKTSPTISTGNLYEIVFTYINDTIGWIGDCLSYSA